MRSSFFPEQRKTNLIVTTNEMSLHPGAEQFSRWTSNDLLFELHGLYTPKTFHYQVVAQSADEVQDIENAPSVSMSHYLETWTKSWLVNTVSIYSQRGKTREQVRLFYFNSVALSIWQAMGKHPTITGALHRPPKAALLVFGVPFSE